MKIYRKLTELIGATPLLKLYGPEKTGKRRRRIRENGML